MADTTKLILPLMASNQAQKYVTYNEAMFALDILTMLSIKDKDLTTPPGSPADGDTYIVGSGATGLWSGKDLNIAAWTNGAWKFFPPKEGWSCWVEDEDLRLEYNGSSWNRPNGAFSGFLRTTDFNVKTIASGVITATQTTTKVATEGGAGSDDLDTINGGAAGTIIILEQSDSSKTVVVKAGTGNIRTFAGTDVTLNGYGKSFMAHYDGFNWIQL